ncbi:drug/metabolite transporter (DMT)-like permease [Pseudacidovorax sp. 1753]|uniref:DMT family transporter n=1 Tax=Pseudacidovorax sp. 1753 TaxID=3156419 RepID=UPI0033927B64
MPSTSPPALHGIAAAYRRASHNATLLLVFTTLMWGCNAVAARLAVGNISPMMLTTARWTICCVALWFTARHEIARHWRTVARSWRLIAIMGTAGFTAFNALFYAAAHHTSAINIAIIQGTIPVLVLLGSFVFAGRRFRPMQALGVAVTLAGCVVVASRGQLHVLATLDFNVGDLWMLLASLFYAGYMLGLTRRPPVPPIVFFAAAAGVAALTSLPLLAFEVVTDRFFMPTATGWALMLFVGLLPSFVSQITFIQAVSLIGPERAGVFVNLTPIFGPLLAVLVLDEPLRPFHLAALALVLGGIWIAERRRRAVDTE